MALGNFKNYFFLINVFSFGLDKSKTHNWSLVIRFLSEKSLTVSFSTLGPARISHFVKDASLKRKIKKYEVTIEATTAIYDDVMIYIDGFQQETLDNGKRTDLSVHKKIQRSSICFQIKQSTEVASKKSTGPKTSIEFGSVKR